MEKYKKNAVFCDLRKYDYLSGEKDFMEVTEWSNREGFDVDIESKISGRFQLTRGQFRALKKLVKALDDFEEKD